jgi:hypothetical protein
LRERKSDERRHSSIARGQAYRRTGEESVEEKERWRGGRRTFFPRGGDGAAGGSISTSTPTNAVNASIPHGGTLDSCNGVCRLREVAASRASPRRRQDSFLKRLQGWSFERGDSRREVEGVPDRSPLCPAWSTRRRLRRGARALPPPIPCWGCWGCFGRVPRLAPSPPARSSAVEQTTSGAVSVLAAGVDVPVSHIPR